MKVCGSQEKLILQGAPHPYPTPIGLALKIQRKSVSFSILKASQSTRNTEGDDKRVVKELLHLLAVQVQDRGR